MTSPTFTGKLITAASDDAILAALIAENERLRSTIYTDNSATVAYATKRIAELEAEVERLKAQEPVAWVGEVSEGSQLLLDRPTMWDAIPLYLASGAAQKEHP